MREKYILVEPVVTTSDKSDGDWATVPIVGGPYGDYDTAALRAENTPYIVVTIPN